MIRRHYHLDAPFLQDGRLAVEGDAPSLEAHHVRIVEPRLVATMPVISLGHGQIEAAEGDTPGPELQRQIDRLEPRVTAPADVPPLAEQERVVPDLAEDLARAGGLRRRPRVLGYSLAAAPAFWSGEVVLFPEGSVGGVEDVGVAAELPAFVDRDDSRLASKAGSARRSPRFWPVDFLAAGTGGDDDDELGFAPVFPPGVEAFGGGDAEGVEPGFEGVAGAAGFATRRGRVGAEGCLFKGSGITFVCRKLSTATVAAFIARCLAARKAGSFALGVSFVSPSLYSTARFALIS